MVNLQSPISRLHFPTLQRRFFVPRVKRGVVSHRRHKKVLKQTKGQVMSRHTLFRRANEALLHSKYYATVGRKKRKNDFRRLWIVRINAAARELSVASYVGIPLLNSDHTLFGTVCGIGTEVRGDSFTDVSCVKAEHVCRQKRPLWANTAASRARYPDVTLPRLGGVTPA